jgi:uncharacterized protein
MKRLLLVAVYGFVFSLQTTQHSRSDLWEAAEKGNVDLVKALISSKAIDNINTKYGEHGTTALMEAAFMGRDDIARVLLAAGANPNVKSDTTGATALDMAAPHTEILKLLLEKGASVNVQRKGGSSPLEEAARAGNIDGVKLLLEAGANPELRNKDGKTALSKAVQYNHPEVVKLLLAHGAKLDIPDKFGYTELMYADNPEIVTMLVAAGANPNTKNLKDRNKTVLDYNKAVRLAENKYKPVDNSAAIQDAIEKGLKERKN